NGLGRTRKDRTTNSFTKGGSKKANTTCPSPCHPRVLDANFLPAAARKAKQKKGSSNEDVREHGQPGAEKPQIEPRPNPEKTEIDPFEGQDVGQRDANSQKTNPCE